MYTNILSLHISLDSMMNLLSVHMNMVSGPILMYPLHTYIYICFVKYLFIIGKNLGDGYSLHIYLSYTCLHIYIIFNFEPILFFI